VPRTIDPSQHVDAASSTARAAGAPRNVQRHPPKHLCGMHGDRSPALAKPRKSWISPWHRRCSGARRGDAWTCSSSS
jgi:hypothetical protein